MSNASDGCPNTFVTDWLKYFVSAVARWIALVLLILHANPAHVVTHGHHRFKIIAMTRTALPSPKLHCEFPLASPLSLSLS